MEDAGKPRKGFRYIQTPYGSLVVAYELVEHLRQRRYRVGVAFCSKRDQFSKQRGKMIAEGRMARGRGYGFASALSEQSDANPSSDGFTYPNVVVETLIRAIRGPRWFPKALAHFHAEQEADAA